MKKRAVIDGTSTGTCSGCGAVILWVRTTPGDKPAPLNPEPLEGTVLSPAQAREVRRSAGGRPAGLVFGLQADGAATWIWQGGPGLFPEAEEADAETSVVYLSHFATCPDAERFSRKERSEDARKSDDA
jgi:hypothetical protein